MPECQSAYRRHRHHEVRHSDDLELIEIVNPAEFDTTPAEAPDP